MRWRTAQYKKIVVCTVDTDVSVLLMSYVSQFYDLCADVNIYAHLVNSALCTFGEFSIEYYDVVSAIFDLGKEKCNALPFCYAFTGCESDVKFLFKGQIQGVERIPPK